MSMTPGQIFWEAVYGGTSVATWNDLASATRDRYEAGAQAAIDAHVSEREDLIVRLVNVVRDSVYYGKNPPDWVPRAQNALSRVQYAPTDQTPTVDTAKDDVIAMLAGLIKEALGDIYDTPGGIFFASLDWKQRAQNALSRLVDAPTDQDPTVDTPKPVEAPTGLSEAQQAITRECDTVRDMLLDKNRRYGNSALEPVRVFSRADPVEQIRVRIDDKLSRLTNRQADDDEDVTLDLIGYLILLRVAERGKDANENHSHSQ